MSQPLPAHMKIVPGSKRPARLPVVIRPLPGDHGELSSWLKLNGVERPLAERGVVIGAEAVTFWRSGFDPLSPPHPAGISFEGGVAYGRDVGYDLRIARQPSSRLFESLARVGLLRCAAIARLMDMESLENQPLECERLVDALGRHDGGHEAAGADPFQLTWPNDEQPGPGSPTLEAEAQEFHAAGMARALVVADRILGEVSYHWHGGVPVVNREAVFAAVNQAARECLGDGWVADLQGAQQVMAAEGPGDG